MQKATYDVPNTISYAKRGFYDVSGCGYFLGASEFRRESKRAAPTWIGTDRCCNDLSAIKIDFCRENIPSASGMTIKK